MSKSEQLYMRPVQCKYCDRVFDFPTMTKDPAENGVPVKTRICGDCISEMGQNEELRASRAQAEQDKVMRRKSLAQAAAHTANLINGHISSLSSIYSVSQRSSSDSDTPSYPTESPEQTQSRLVIPENSAPQEPYRMADRRSPSAVHRLLN